MKYIIRIFLVFFLLLSSSFAGKLEIKLSGKNIDLPFWSAQKDQQGSVLFIHGGEQPQWSILLAHMAKQLSKYGWSVALLNCSPGSDVPWIKQLPEAINALRLQKSKRIIVVHYGDQVKQTLESFSNAQAGGVEGLILLSAYDMPLATPPEPAKAEKKLEVHLPLFDIAGQFDYGLVTQQMSARELEFGNGKYLAIQIPGAHHDYEYSHQILLSYLQGWMLKLAELKPPPVLASYIESMAALMPKLIVYDTEADWTGYIDNPEEPAE